MGVFRHSLALIGEIIIFGYHGADDIHLPPGLHLLADKGVQSGIIGGGNGVGLNGLAAGGELVNNGNIQITVENQRQRPGNGRGGHDQRVGVLALFCQRCPLGHAEAVLLVRYHKAEVGIGHAAGDEGVGADGKVQLAGGKLCRNGTLCFGGSGAGKQGTAKP